MNSGSHFCQDDLTITIDQTDLRQQFPRSYPFCSAIGRLRPKVGNSRETILAHELLGHAWAHATGRDIYDERIARGTENIFRGRGQGENYGAIEIASLPLAFDHRPGRDWRSGFPYVRRGLRAFYPASVPP